MPEAILVLNAGSSSIKFSLFSATSGGGGADPERVAAGQVAGIYTAPTFVAKDADGRVVDERRWESGAALGHDRALTHVLEWVKASFGREHRLAAVGHRIVHGGRDYAAPLRLDAAVLAALERLVPLAPLHLPHNLAAVRALLAQAPEVPQVACFDTAMHRTQPRLAQMFGLPQGLDDAGVRRYGFHGLSYEYVAAVLPGYDARAAEGKTVVLHLGNGASMCALAAGKSVATTMGFSTLDGLPMSTRAGALDPGVLLYLMDEHGMDARALEALLYERSGLLGVSGVSSDVRELLASKEPRAALAVELFVYRIGRELGSLAAALGGLDAVVFTAGIGENQADIRQAVCRDAAWLGLELDAEANAAHGPRISTTASRTAAWVIPTNEELMIARHTRAVLVRG